MTLGATEFIRRFLLHVLPPGFHRIRSYGLFGHRHRTIHADYRDHYEALTGCSVRVCPRCHDGHMLVVERLVGTPDRPRILDTS